MTMSIIISLTLFCFLSQFVIPTIQLDFTDTHFNCFRGNGITYTEKSNYHFNLNTLLPKLTSDSKIDYGFYNSSYGKNPDTVYAIGLCRADLNPDSCRSCINNVTRLLPKNCSNQKEAVGYSEGCIVRYSDKSIFGLYQNPEFSFIWFNVDNTTDANFNPTVNGMLQNLASKAAAGDSRRKFAASNVKGLFQKTIYGLVQCTPDLSEQDCGECLQKAIVEINGCCEDNVGAFIIKLSCNVRYEVYPFYDREVVNSLQLSLPPPPPPPSDPKYTFNTTTSSPGNNKISNTVIIAIVVPLAAIILMLIIIYIYFRVRKPRQAIQTEIDGEIEFNDSIQLDFETIRTATDNFADANKLGQGGFGPVYKGKLYNGQEVAVKRLSINSGQGEKEFKNEVTLVAKLQHRNLVRLLGYCLERGERLLVYEFLPNKSLDYLLFDPYHRPQLNWVMRHKIIEGVARGLLYLHEDSRLRIIHRDLKASNILLDAELNAKISDFGMARLFVTDQTQSNTNRIVGTYGYMAPEYAMNGQFSIKSDVFSFGVLILEIVSGKKNNSIFNGDNAQNLIGFAWENWREGTASNIIDPVMNNGSSNEMIKCIHIGLLCVQENVANRPTMASVALMLSSNSLTLPIPSEPPFMSNRSLLEMNSLECSSSETTGLTKGRRNYVVEASRNEVSITDIHPR